MSSATTKWNRPPKRIGIRSKGKNEKTVDLDNQSEKACRKLTSLPLLQGEVAHLCDGGDKRRFIGFKEYISFLTIPQSATLTAPFTQGSRKLSAKFETIRSKI